MGFFGWLFHWLGWSSDDESRGSWAEPFAKHKAEDGNRTPTTAPATTERSRNRSAKKLSRRPKLTECRRDKARRKARTTSLPYVEARETPYRFARYGIRRGNFLDLSQDGDDRRLQARRLPVFRTPEQLAGWLGLPLNKLAWLVHRFSYGRPDVAEQSHYHYRWLRKNSGGWRLIESPKRTLKQTQVKILREILDRVPTHSAAHGFVTGRSILTNAKPHVGHALLVKFDLANFYTTVGFSRVVAIFRTLGYSREAAIWLALLTTSALPGNMAFPGRDPYAFVPYLRRHLPQGAPTSPALANLSAYRLDLRLAGLSKSFGATYTRYADDMAISGPKELSGGLRTLIPLVQQIVRQERFHANTAKRRVLRANQRQILAGVVVNAKPNVARADFDRLKATLTNCVRLGPSTQNREQHENFAAHLRGRIAHVLQLNWNRGEKLLAIYRRIDWRR